jgi:dTDP-4-dehydrorhamnose reductase
MSLRLLVIGASGFLGTEVLNLAREAGHTAIGTAYSASVNGLTHLDVRDRDAFARLKGDVKPDAVINTAAVMNDWATTALAPIGIAAECAASLTRFVHVSSDAVFIGGDRDSYDETSPPVAAVNPAAAIVRTSWIVGNGRSPFETFVQALAAGKAEGGLFTDDFRCPVHVTDLAAALLELCPSDYAGVLHAAGADMVSRYELGVLIARRDGLNTENLPQVTKSAIGEPGATVRLDSAKAAGALETELRGANAFTTGQV